MKREDLKNWTRNMMKDKILAQEEIIEQWKCDIEENLQDMVKVQCENDEMRKRLEKLESENKALKDENTALKQRIKDLEDVCDGSCFSDEPDYRDKQIEKMEDKIASVEVRNFRSKVTIDTLVDMYAALRKQAGMD